MSSNLRDQLQTTLSGSYTIERELGGGGMSRVFLAEETQLSRKVVVKVLSTELAAEISAERFQREIKTAASLQQANIVPVLTAGNAGGVPYFTMPYVEGESLRARLGRTGALSITEAVKVMGDIARALAYAHERGIVHRDIKPDNVLLSGGTAVVTDFGIAKAITAARTDGGGKSPTLTQLGTALGTPAYMAPEQAAGDPSTDHRADFYAFGCTAYELLTGRPPFIDKTPQRLLAAHMGLAPEAVTSLRPDVPQQLAELVMRCLEKEAPRRPSTAGEIIASLDAVSTASGGSHASMPPVLLGGTAMFRKALAIYGIAFVAVAILAKAAIVGIGLPDWVFPGSLVVMALGLPAILWTGYVQRVARRAATATPTYTPGGTSAVRHGTMATMALKAVPHVSWYKTARGGAYALGAFVLTIAAFMAMRAYGIGPFGSLIASGRVDRNALLVFTDFATSATDSTLGRVASDGVRAGLAQSNAIRVMDVGATAAALGRMQRPAGSRVDLATAREIALRDGARAIVDGEVTGLGIGYLFVLRLKSSDGGADLWSTRLTADDARGLIGAIDDATRQLRGKLGESLKRVQSAPALAEVTTGSLEALQRYSDAERASAVRDFLGARRLMREAVAIDTGFAEGWRRLAVILAKFPGQRAAIDSASRRAYEARQRLSPRERDLATIAYFQYGQGADRVKALAAYEALLARGDSSALGEHAQMYWNQRQFARAESLNRAHVVRNPGDLPFTGNLMSLLRTQGKLVAAESLLNEMKARFPGNRRPHLYSMWLMYSKGDLAQYGRSLDSARRDRDPFDPVMVQTMWRGYTLVTGRLSDWRAAGETLNSAVEEVSGAAARASNSAAAADRFITTFFVAGSATNELREFRTALASDDGFGLNISLALALAGDVAGAKARLERLVATLDTTRLRTAQPFLHNARAWIAYAEKRWDDAVREFREGDRRPDGPVDRCTICLPVVLATVFDVAGQADSAIANYEKFITTPLHDRWAENTDGIGLPRAHERLGSLYEAKGNAQKAAEHYAKFVELWKNADPELQPRVAEAKARLAKLGVVEQPKK